MVVGQRSRRLLVTLAHGQPVGRTRDAATPVSLAEAQTPVQRLLAMGLNDHYRQIFELTRLDEAIGIFDSEAEAVAAATSA